ncbi:WYL domain-containing protein [Acinetobacter sp. WCHAc060033]|uniref:helix-turn-helix transcriptional regulator n=1 Tax=Acinetobacter sp. WCHAc060033 TaxID=2518624 RepID=UPI001022C411|nr:WYL domain-containing protein [Acinetobacter sp. WCHAc060033]RZG77033.1 WYL domain-containing protein [Acinetobacter sp. WCHAc060033]
MSDFILDRQNQRLVFIDLCAFVLGYVNRTLLMNRFSIKEATASKDIKAYQDKTSNLQYYPSIAAYKPLPWFCPLYTHDIHEALLLLAENKQEVICQTDLSNTSYVLQIPVNKPQLKKVCPVLRALSQKGVVDIEYASRTSGISSRTIIPHTLIQMGPFIYVRAYDRLKEQFRTFKLNRIINSTTSTRTIAPAESIENDIEWHKNLEVTIVPNGTANLETLELDYHLINNQMVVQLKKEVLMYFLMGWNIAPIEYEDLPYTLFPLKVASIKPLP